LFLESLDRVVMVSSMQASATPSPPAVDRERSPDLSGLPNPFRSALQPIQTIEASVAQLRQVMPLSELAGSDDQAPWCHYGLTTHLGEIPLHAGILQPLRLVVEQPSALMVCLGYGGIIQLCQASRSWHCWADGCVVLAAQPYRWSNSQASCVVFTLLQERLLRTALAMAGWSQPPAAWLRTLDRAHGSELPATGEEPSLQAGLRDLLASAVRLRGYSQSLVDRLQLDDQIYRLLAAMMLPELRQEAPLDRLRHREQLGRDVFDELIDYIKANLAQPLNLTALELRSNYSRRALQYAFRERLGCTASQWIRHQRLDFAQRRLQNPSPGDSVASIALACGYRSMGLFSVDFQQRFHVKPSHLLREASCSFPPEAH
jgi:AraC-like DNA-binding protein